MKKSDEVRFVAGAERLDDGSIEASVVTPIVPFVEPGGRVTVRVEQDTAAALWHVLGDVLDMEHSESAIRERDELLHEHECALRECAALSGERDALADALGAAYGDRAKLRAERDELAARLAEMTDARDSAMAAVAYLRGDKARTDALLAFTGAENDALRNRLRAISAERTAEQGLTPALNAVLAGEAA